MISSTTDSQAHFATFGFSKRFGPLERIWEYAKRARNKIYATLRQLPGLKVVAEHMSQRQLSAHRPHLPALEAEDQPLLRRLQEDGTFTLPLNVLNLSLSKPFWQSSLKLAEELRSLPSHGRSSIGLSQQRLMEHPEIYLWGLETRLINIVENYLGLPVLYHGCSIRRDIANAEQGKGIRQWHIDCEGERVIKVIVYFNDVSEGGGCYNYIPKSLTTQALRSLNYRSNEITDKQMAKVLPQEHWRACPGDQGTVIITDTGSLFHRAQSPTTEDRFSISFCYTSQKPNWHWVFDQVSAEQWKRIYARLGQGKERYLVNHNRLLSVKKLVR